jgi:Holliday junction resolvase RusA-like endonuclease
VPDLRLIVAGEPVPKGRPKFARVRTRSGREFVSTYTPKKTRDFEAVVREQATLAVSGFLDTTGSNPLMFPLTDIAMDVTALFVLAIPKSFTKRERELALAGAMRPVVKPDLDNLFKAVTDAMEGVVFAADSRIVTAQLTKFYGADPRAEIIVRW